MQRLSGLVDPGRREELGQALAGRVASLVDQAGLTPLIVTADKQVVAWAGGSGFAVATDPGRGLDAACQVGVSWATDNGYRWMVIHADLPLLVAGDLRALTRPMARGADVIAPSADGGTTAISSTGRFSFSYGPASFHRHLSRLTDPEVVTRTGLLHDLDSPNDFLSASRHPAGDWI